MKRRGVAKQGWRWGIIVAATVLIASQARARPPDAGDDACRELSGGARGLCNAYCNAQRCDERPERRSCAALRTNLENQTGTAIFPCDRDVPTPTPGSATATATPVDVPSPTPTPIDTAEGVHSSLLDHKAAIAGVFAFRSYEPGSANNVTLILTVDPFSEPANGANPFDPEILYALKIDNDNDAVEDISFEFRFATEIRMPDVYTGLIGAGAGANAPANSPPPVAPGTPVVPPRITSFDDPGLGLRQTYTVTQVSGGVRTDLAPGTTLFALPADVGPRTMDYQGLFGAAVRTLPGGMRVFAGTVEDPLWMDRGGASDTFNTSKSPPVLSPAEDAAAANVAADSHSGFNVNAIALEVPIAMLTRTGAIEPATSTAATIGVWATTSRPSVKALPSTPGGPATVSTDVTQIQRLGNPFINELLVGIGSKEAFAMDQPVNDGQFAGFFLDPVLARVINALTAGALAIPAPPRADLLPLFTYGPPIAASGTPGGPIADLLRLNTGVPPTAAESANRLGLLRGDAGGFPNGRRVVDDVFDIALRLVVGGVLAPPFPGFDANLNAQLGDGVNVNDVPFRTTFPYLANAHSGRSRRHIDPGEPGCTAGAGAPCLP